MSILPMNSSSTNDAHSSSLSNNNNFNSVGEASEMNSIVMRIDAALQQIQILKKNNAEMKRIIENNNNPTGEIINSNNNNGVGSNNNDRENPSAMYEETRRQLDLNLKELWYNLRSKAGHLEEIDFDQVADIYRFVIYNIW
jgi:hypothetical protein